MKPRIEMIQLSMVQSERLRVAVAGIVLVSVWLCGAAACSLKDVVGVDVQTQGTVIDASAVNSHVGAQSLYNWAVIGFQGALSGNLGLANGQAGGGAPALIDGMAFETDETVDLSPSSVITADVRGGTTGKWESLTFSLLSTQRVYNQQAITLMLRYAAEFPKAYLQRLYSQEAMAEVFLAEDVCNGIPLGTVPFDSNFTYSPGLTTSQVLQHAVALFDTALTYGTDSASILTLTRVGKGRALLDLGSYADAAQAVAEVPTNATFQIFSVHSSTIDNRLIGIVNNEGGAGMVWIAPTPAQQDPRVPIKDSTTGAFRLPYEPAKDSLKAGVNNMVTISSGVEARLIEAENALAAGNAQWLAILNTLRTTCTTSVGCATPAPAGSGGVVGLPPLSDPGSDTARVSLLFHERAFWLYLTGHRQGDLRRLVRQYHRPVEQVFPTGLYGVGFRTTVPAGSGSYGPYVVAAVPATEAQYNPLYHGCFDQDP